MRLMDTATDTEIMTGCMLRPVESPRIPWRLESLYTTRDGVAMIHASRHTRAGRVHRTFHPHAFGFEIVLDVTISRRQHVQNAAHVAYRKLCDYLMGGLLALLPLAFFEYFHMADKLFESVGLGKH